MTSLHALESGANLTGTATAGHGKQLAATDGSLGLNWFGMMPNLIPQSNGASFASLFAGATANAPAATDPLAQLTALVQSGTPMSTIIDRLAQQLASAVQKQLPANMRAGTGGQLDSTLAKSIANALAPPGNAPPGTASQEVAALAQRLQRWIATLAGDAKTTAGQQNDIAGKLLDAKSAKDIPAQRKTESSSTTVDAGLLTHALLNSVASALTTASAAAPSSTPASTAQTTPDAPNSAPGSNAQSTPVPQITIANAPDLLARMLVRAASVDARINGISAQGSQVAGNGGTGNTPSALAARFAAALASIAEKAAGSATNGSSNGSNSARDYSEPSEAKSQPSNTSSALGASAALNAPVSTTSFTTQVQAQSRPDLDANAVVAQVVKSMVMRTNQSGTSEIRLRLNPENLGEVTMKLTISGSSISANLVAQNGDVRHALLSNHQQLARSLSEAGLTLSGFSVDVSGGDAGRDQNKDRTGGFGRRYVVHELSGVDASESAQPSSLGPQLLPGSNLELFNYLA